MGADTHVPPANRGLDLYNNSIRELPRGIFSSLTSLFGFVARVRRLLILVRYLCVIMRRIKAVLKVPVCVDQIGKKKRDVLEFFFLEWHKFGACALIYLQP